MMNESHDNRGGGAPNTNITVTVKTDQQHQQVQSGGSVSWIKLNHLYFLTLPGILKLVQVLVGIICMILASPAYFGGTQWFLFVVVVSFIITVVWCFIYLLSIRDHLKLPFDWTVTEFYYTAGAAVLYLIAFIVQLSVWGGWFRHWRRGENIAAGVFGIFNFAAYAAGAYFLRTETKEVGAPQ